jgi:hypothetical protein
MRSAQWREQECPQLLLLGKTGAALEAAVEVAAAVVVGDYPAKIAERARVLPMERAACHGSQ